MTDKPPPRRAAFDEITVGWGADTIGDLGARLELAFEWEKTHKMAPAEERVMIAMLRRYGHLGGVSSTR